MSRSRPILAIVALSLGALALGALGCDQEKIRPPEDTRADVADIADIADDGADTSAPLDSGASTVCTPNTEFSGCAEGLFCETTARICVECVGLESRCSPAGEREVCGPPVAAGLGELVSGGFFEPAPCGGEEVCVAQSATRATCEPLVCTPSERRCVDAQVVACNANGTEESVTTCDPGQACYQGSCQYLRHNVLIIFDTSGSMHDYIDATLPGSPIQCTQNDTPCLDPFPICDDPDHPLTLISLAKRVFAESVREAIGGFAQFALQRFPQRESAANEPTCWLGWYLPISNLTGDDDAYATEDGGWFDQNLGQAFIVPFPSRDNLNNRDELLEWLDNDERLGASERPCSTHAECGTGRCGTVNGEHRCFYHTEDELRAGGETPLGKSLFYAGEYFRRHVVVDGKPCETAANCGSTGYLCRDGRCVDPYRECRDNFIILFTDGQESEHQDETDFFNPVVQARRLAFGLDCDGDDDCRGGASCDEGRCLAPAGRLQPELASVLTGGHDSLSSPDGQPISVKTTVITLETGGTASVKNRRIAAAGGGVHIDVTAGDPETFKALLIDAMSPNFKCAPDDL